VVALAASSLVALGAGIGGAVGARGAANGSAGRPVPSGVDASSLPGAVAGFDRAGRGHRTGW
jgi:hypothetical protein